MWTVRPALANRPLWTAMYSGASSTPGWAATVIDDRVSPAELAPVPAAWQPAATMISAAAAIPAEATRERREGSRGDTILAPAGPDLMALPGEQTHAANTGPTVRTVRTERNTTIAPESSVLSSGYTENVPLDRLFSVMKVLMLVARLRG